jgi:hypothetical protein
VDNVPWSFTGGGLLPPSTQALDAVKTACLSRCMSLGF